MEFNACHDTNPFCSFLTCFIDDGVRVWVGSECGWGLGEVASFQLARGPQNYVLGHNQTEGAI